ncbi:MAG: LPS export ABC transporter periplasmic protein LptC [Candidatus Omnitrophota bacterium]
MKYFKPSLIVILILLIAWSLKSLLFNEEKSKNVTSDKNADAITEKVQSFSLQGFSESGELIWQINGKSADIYADVINLTDISADSHNKDITVNLKSDKGVFNRKSNDLKLYENVVVITSDGSRLTTDSLNWDAAKELITTQERVYIEREDMNAVGLGARALPSLKKAQLNEDVKVNIKKPIALITCDGPMEIDYGNNITFFNNNVKLDDSKAQIRTDKATAYFDPDKRLLTKVLCEGNVYITRGDDITNSEKLTYFPGEGRVVLDGRPRIIINSADKMIEEVK